MTHTSGEIETIHPLLAILQGNVTGKNTIELDLKYLHELHLSNVKKLPRQYHAHP